MGQPWIAPDTPAEPRSVAPLRPVAAGEPTSLPAGPLRDSPMGRLAPRGIWSVLDGGFEVVRYRFTTIAIVTACIVVPFTAAPTLLAYLDQSHRLDELREMPGVNVGFALDSNTSSVLSILSELTSYLALALLGVGIAHLLGAWLTGRDPSTGEVLRVIGRRSGVALAAWVVAVPIKALGLLACGIGIVWTIAMFVVLSPVVAIEGLGPFAAIRRSWRLSARRRSGTMLLLVTASWLLTVAFQAIVAGLAAVIQSQVTGDVGWSWIVFGVLSVGFHLFLMPVQAAWAGLAYFDLRVRSEGLDLELAAADLFDRGR